MAGKVYTNTRWYVDVSDLNRLAARLARSAEDLEKGFEAGHRAVAALLTGRVRQHAAGRRQDSAVVNDSRAFSTRADSTGASLRLRGARALTPTGPKDPVRFALGAEFGAKRDILRQVKVKSRFEAGQGRIRKRRGRDSENDFGAFRVMKGWNQFREWRGSANASVGEDIEPGYFMWPAVRDSQDEVDDVYGESSMNVISATLANRPL